MKRKATFVVACLLVGLATIAFGQQRSESHAINFTIPNIYVLDVDNADGSTAPNTTVAITLSDPTDPGAEPDVAYSNNDNYLNYTSVVASGAYHQIEASLSSTLDGVNIRLSVTAASQYGNTGTSTASNLVLDGTSQQVIQNIGSCFTGTSGTDGAAVVYDITFDSANFGSLLAASPTRDITYTISDQ